MQNAKFSALQLNLLGAEVTLRQVCSASEVPQLIAGTVPAARSVHFLRVLFSQVRCLHPALICHLFFRLTFFLVFSLVLGRTSLAEPKPLGDSLPLFYFGPVVFIDTTGSSSFVFSSLSLFSSVADLSVTVAGSGPAEEAMETLSSTVSGKRSRPLVLEEQPCSKVSAMEPLPDLTFGRAFGSDENGGTDDTDDEDLETVRDSSSPRRGGYEVPRRTTLVVVDGPCSFQLVDPLGEFAGDTVKFLLTAKEACPEVAISRLSSTSSGLRFRVERGAEFAARFRAAAAFFSCSLSTPVAAPRTFDVPLRVPVDVPTDAVLADLREQFGSAVCSLRRLHATTDGSVDSSRPLPRVVAVVRGKEVADRVAEARLFGVVRLRDGAPRELDRVPQCFRCYAWGHRAVACTARRRCVRCGATDHDSSSCGRPRDERFCFRCDTAGHGVTWGGCPKRSEFLRTRKDGRPSAPPVPRSFTAVRVSEGRSFAVAAATPSPKPQRSPPRRRAAQAGVLSKEEAERAARMRDLAVRTREAKQQLETAVKERDEAREDRDALLSNKADGRFAAASKRVLGLRKRIRKLESQRDREGKSGAPSPQPERRGDDIVDLDAEQEVVQLYSPPRARVTLGRPTATEETANGVLQLVLRALQQVQALARLVSDPVAALAAMEAVSVCLTTLLSRCSLS